MPIPQDAEFFGIEFSAGTFLPDLPPGRLVDRTLTLPQVSDRSFWLDGSAWEFPGPDNADVFVARLGRAGLLVHDPIVAEALHGEVAACPPGRWSDRWREGPASPAAPSSGSAGPSERSTCWPVGRRRPTWRRPPATPTSPT